METYEIKGMTCQHCVQAVTKALGKVPGVVKVQGVDLASGRAVIEGTPDEQAVLAALQDEGYQARHAT